MRYTKSWTEALLEVQDITEDAKMGKQSDDQLKKLYKTASEKDQSSPANKSFTQRVAKEMKKRGISEQEGVRKVDFVDGVTPDLQEAKPEFEVKYASSKKGPIKVSKFMSMDDAKEFLAQVKKDGMNGIISKGGKPVKEDHHEKDANGEPIPHDDEENVEEARKSYDDKEMRKKLKTPKHANRKTAGDEKKARELAQRKKLGLEEVEINEADYELYHKDFSSAMQHAYAHAKKKGFTVDPEEIDNKVATGPRKPSKGKTNRYILGTDKKKNLHVQVANLDNKRYELNMYIEETEMNEKKLDPVGQADADIDNDGDVDSSDKYLKNRRKKISKAIKSDESKLYSHVKSMMKKEYLNMKKMKKK